MYTNQEGYSSVYCTVFENICSCGDSTIEYLCNDIEQNTAPEDDLITYVQVDGRGFCAVALLEGSDKFFCVDGELHAKEYGVSPASPGGPCDLPCEAANNCSVNKGVDFNFGMRENIV